MSQKRHFEIDGKFDGQKVEYDAPHFRQQLLELCGNRPCPVTVRVTKTVDSKTARQNRYFHGVVCKTYHNAMLSVGENTVTVSYGSITRVFARDVKKSIEEFKHTLSVYVIEDGKLVPLKIGKASKEEMSFLIEAGIIYLRDNFGIEVPPPPEKETKK